MASEEQRRVDEMRDEKARGRTEHRKFRWNPHTKSFETDASAHEDVEKLTIKPEDMGHSVS